MAARILILGAGFGGLELATTLSESLGEEAEVTLIDKGEAFVFGFSKLDLMFGAAAPEAVRMPYAEFVKPGVRVLRETVTAIDPEASRVSTDAGTHEADFLVIALGADYDFEATPGLREAGNEFYSVAGAERLAEIIPAFSSGHARDRRLRGALQVPAGAERVRAATRRRLRERGVRDDCRISFVIPLASPVPPSPETSAALEAEFAERGIELIVGRRIAALDPGRSVAVLDDGAELPFDLFLGVPKHRAPDVVLASGMTEDGYVPVDPATLRTRFAGVYAVGDVATAGVPKAGVFAEGAARIVAQHLLAEIAGGDEPGRSPRPGHLLHRVRRGPDRQRRHRLPLRPRPQRQLQPALGRQMAPRRRASAPAAAPAGSGEPAGQRLRL